MIDGYLKLRTKDPKMSDFKAALNTVYQKFADKVRYDSYPARESNLNNILKKFFLLETRFLHQLKLLLTWGRFLEKEFFARWNAYERLIKHTC